MGGHGGLNILPQKRWNVYNFDNREKVRIDEETAAKEEQIKREQSRKRDTELRVLKLRKLRGLTIPEPEPEPEPVPEPVEQPKNESSHINLFAGIKIFDPKQGGIDIEAKPDRKEEKERERRSKKMKEEEVKVITPEDEPYRLGYGLVGKGSKLPWYLAKKAVAKESEGDGDDDDDDDERGVVRKSKGKKTLEELREERLVRERKEKEREKALFVHKSRRDRGFSSRR